jgi:uncharacterized protein
MWKTWGLRLLIVIAVLYAALVGYMYMNQRHLLYLNSAVAETPDIDGMSLEAVTLRTSDGETLQAWYLPPQPGKPVFLFFHGNASTLMMGRWRYAYMQAAGAGFLAPAYRGYGASTGAPTEDGLYKDGMAAYTWLIDKGYRPEDIVIHGHSLGSGVAVWLSTQVPSRALILEAPFTATVDVAAQSYPFIPVSWLMTDRFESRERIAAVKAPVLIAHGTRDRAIPFAHGERLYALAPEPKRFVRMEGSDHNTLVGDGLYTYVFEFTGVE